MARLVVWSDESPITSDGRYTEPPSSQGLFHEDSDKASKKGHRAMHLCSAPMSLVPSAEAVRGECIVKCLSLVSIYRKHTTCLSMTGRTLGRQIGGLLRTRGRVAMFARPSRFSPSPCLQSYSGCIVEGCALWCLCKLRRDRSTPLLKHLRSRLQVDSMEDLKLEWEELV